MKKEKAERVRDLVNERDYYNGILSQLGKVWAVCVRDKTDINNLVFVADDDGFEGKVCSDMIHSVKEECRRRIEYIDEEIKGM